MHDKNEIPNEVVDYALSIMEDHDCADNLRIARADDPEQIKNYERIRESGCCGAIDYFEFYWGGIKYFFGFNYGH